MVGQLVLLRHGIAEPRGLGVGEEQRALTEAGREKIRQIVPGLQRLLDPSLAWKIAASPLARAAETADLAAKGLNLPVVIMPALAEGDWPAVVQELLALSGRDGVILVGHEPFLGEWSRLMTGLALPFKKGAAAGYRFRATDNGSVASLRWFIQPRELISLGKEAL